MSVVSPFKTLLHVHVIQAAKAAEAGKKDEKGKKSGRSTSAGKRSKSPGKKKGKKEADLPPSPKKDTKLKRRGDVEDTFKTIGKNQSNINKWFKFCNIGFSKEINLFCLSTHIATYGLTVGLISNQQ